MCERAAVIITTVGPYQLHGPELVAACAATGTAYVDLCGEPACMRRMIDAHHERRNGPARASSSPAASIPSRSISRAHVQEKAREKFGRPARRVKARLRNVKGGMSGGTAASARATLAAAARDPALIRLLTDPCVDAGVHRAVSAVRASSPNTTPSMNVWLVPFPMAADQHKNVHRTNFLLGHPYGTDFVYDEMMVAPRFGEIARVTTETFATMVSLFGTGGLKTRRRPDFGRAREGLLRHPLPGRAAGWRTGRGGSHGRPRSGLRLDQQR